MEKEKPELVVKPQKTSAAGLPSVINAARHVAGKMGPVRGLTTMLRINQKGGFDCMSCAWPDPDGHRSHIAEYCENGAKAVADEGTTKLADAEFFARYSVEELNEQSDYWLNSQGRLSEPFYLGTGESHYRPVSWEWAFQLLGGELKALSSPDQASFYTSGRTSNEAAFLYQLFARSFGTNNLPDCSNMCHESSGVALIEAIGSGKGTVTLGDFESAELIVLLGQNPGTNHPRMLSTLESVKRRGGRIISVNPQKEAGLTGFKHPQHLRGLTGKATELTDYFLRVRIGGDQALLKGLIKRLLELDAGTGKFIDREFIVDHTSGYEQMLASLEKLGWAEIELGSGLTRAEISVAAEMLASSRATIFCWAMGLTQHHNAVATIQELVNLALLQGNIGKPGAGVCPVRGHSNVQGDRTVGITERPSAAFLDALGREFRFEPPSQHGLDTVGTIRAMYEGRVRVFVGLGGNFLSASPDTSYTSEAMRRCKLTVHISTKLNRSHLIHGEHALILPCLGRTEIDLQASGPQFVTTENSMAVVQSSQGVNPPASDKLLSEPMIVAKLAAATLTGSQADWLGMASDYDRIRERIERVIPGFEDYNRNARRAGGFYLPNPPRQRVFRTPEQKALFTANPLEVLVPGEGELVMMTIRSHDQFNTTIYGLDDRYRGIFNGRQVVLVNREDLKLFGIESGSQVDIVSLYEGQERRVEGFTAVAYDLPRGCCATYFPEANVLIPVGQVARRSNTPVSKSVLVRLVA